MMLADFLRKKREEKGLSQIDVGRQLGYTSSQFISNIERGTATPPIPVLQKLAELYQIPDEEMYNSILSSYVATFAAELRRDYFKK